MPSIKFSLTIILMLILSIYDCIWYPLIEPAVKWLTLVSLAWFISRRITRDFLCESVLPKVDSRKKAVIITGCDSGFGHDTALRLNKEGFFVFAGFLDANSIQANEMKEKVHDTSRLVCLQLNVTDDDQVEAAYKKVKQIISHRSDVDKLYALVNNAGIAMASIVEGGGKGSQDVYLKHLQVNTMGVIRVTKAFLPLLRQAKHSRIVNVSSMSARVNFAMLNPYGLSKAATSRFTEGLQDELACFGIKTIGVEPWFFKTPLTEPGRLTKELMGTFGACSDETQDAYSHKIDDLAAQLELALNSSFVVARFPQVVTETIARALMSVEPDSVYRIIPAYLQLFIWIITDLLPWEGQTQAKKMIQTAVQWAVRVKGYLGNTRVAN